jgi:anti-anti-sigma factor
MKDRLAAPRRAPAASAAASAVLAQKLVHFFSHVAFHVFGHVTGVSYKLVLVFTEEKIMQIEIKDAGATANVTMIGRLDIAGAEVVALPLATLAGSKTGLVVNMAGVTFIASIGLRHLVSAAQKVARRGGRVVLLNPTEAVTDVITTSGLTDLLFIERDGTSQN